MTKGKTDKIQLSLEARSVLGRKVGQIRREGLLPGVVYGKSLEPIPVQTPVKNFVEVYAKAGESTLIYVDIGDKSYPAMIQDVVRDKLDGSFQHADFFRVRLDEKITAKIPLEFIGEAPAVKNYGCIIVKNIYELEAEALPQDLPHNIEVNISVLNEIGNQILVKDLLISDKVKIKARPEDIIVLAQAPITEEELKTQLETPTVSAEDVEIIKKEKKEEEPAPETTPPAQQ
jgi:large subunit ribosomal protein L25